MAQNQKNPIHNHHVSTIQTRIVAQEIVLFLETIHGCFSRLASLPSYLTTTTTPKPLLTQRLVHYLETIHTIFSFFKTLYLFTASDLPTFLLPTLIFALASTASGQPLLTIPVPPLTILTRLPTATLLITLNLLTFNISNQRLPTALAEDKLNKPHRPLPSNRITLHAATQLNLALVPLLLATSHLARVLPETTLLLALQWMYNDLRGCDTSLLLRNALIAAGYACYNAIALCILSGHAVSPRGYAWLGVTTLVILCTQHICDIKDAAGDALRGRRSAPLVMGDAACRWSVAVPVLLCSALCPLFFRSGLGAYVGSLALGGLVAGRTLLLRDLESDVRTWKLWALWTCGIFLLPLAAGLEGWVWGVGETLGHWVCPGHECVGLNLRAVGGVVLGVKGGSVVGWFGTGERNVSVEPDIRVEVIA